MNYTNLSQEEHRNYRERIMKLHGVASFDNPNGHDALHILLLKLDKEVFKVEKENK